MIQGGIIKHKYRVPSTDQDHSKWIVLYICTLILNFNQYIAISISIFIKIHNVSSWNANLMLICDKISKINKCIGGNKPIKGGIWPEN